LEGKKNLAKELLVIIQASTHSYGRISSPSQTLGKGVKLGERTVDDYIGV